MAELKQPYESIDVPTFDSVDRMFFNEHGEIVLVFDIYTMFKEGEEILNCMFDFGYRPVYIDSGCEKKHDNKIKNLSFVFFEQIEDFHE